MNRKLNIVPHASVFPFLSVLACVIGVLALLIGMLAPSQAEGQKVAQSAEEIKEIEEVRERVKFAEIDISRLIQRRLDAVDVYSQLDKSDAELNDLKRQEREAQERVQSIAESKVRLRNEFDLLTQQIVELEPSLSEVKKTTAEVQTQLDERLKPQPEAVTRIRRSGSRSIEPVFIECRPDSIAIHESEEPLVVPVAELRSNAEYLGLLERVAGVPDGAVIFMIRSNAVTTYLTARDVARGKSCRNGKVPLVGEGAIDLSLVRRQMEKEAEE